MFTGRGQTQILYIYSILGSDRSHNPESALPLPIVDETASRQFIFSTFSFSAHQSHWHKQVFPFLRWFPCKWTEFNKKMNNAMWQSFRLGAVFIFCHGSGVGGSKWWKIIMRGNWVAVCMISYRVPFSGKICQQWRLKKIIPRYSTHAQPNMSALWGFQDLILKSVRWQNQNNFLWRKLRKYISSKIMSQSLGTQFQGFSSRNENFLFSIDPQSSVWYIYSI